MNIFQIKTHEERLLANFDLVSATFEYAGNYSNMEISCIFQIAKRTVKIRFSSFPRQVRTNESQIVTPQKVEELEAVLASASICAARSLKALQRAEVTPCRSDR